VLDVSFAIALGTVAWLFIDVVTGAACSVAVWGGLSLIRLALRDT